jgi:hypothetical protein
MLHQPIYYCPSFLFKKTWVAIHAVTENEKEVPATNHETVDTSNSAKVKSASSLGRAMRQCLYIRYFDLFDA